MNFLRRSCHKLRFYSITNIMSGQKEEKIRNCLRSKLQPSHLQIVNESNQHNVPKGI